MKDLTTLLDQVTTDKCINKETVRNAPDLSALAHFDQAEWIDVCARWFEAARYLLEERKRTCNDVVLFVDTMHQLLPTVSRSVWPTVALVVEPWMRALIAKSNCAKHADGQLLSGAQLAKWYDSGLARSLDDLLPPIAQTTESTGSIALLLKCVDHADAITRALMNEVDVWRIECAKHREPHLQASLRAARDRVSSAIVVARTGDEDNLLSLNSAAESLQRELYAAQLLIQTRASATLGAASSTSSSSASVATKATATAASSSASSSSSSSSIDFDDDLQLRTAIRLSLADAADMTSQID
jgi:hypothetical protein